MWRKHPSDPWRDGLEIQAALGGDHRKSWSDPPDKGRSADQWPYPDEHILSEPPESLARAIRNRMVLDDGVKITLLTTVISGGCSSMTQENDYLVKILVNGYMAWSTPRTANSENNALVELLNWLDEPPSPQEVDAVITSIAKTYKEDA